MKEGRKKGEEGREKETDNERNKWKIKTQKEQKAAGILDFFFYIYT